MITQDEAFSLAVLHHDFELLDIDRGIRIRAKEGEKSLSVSPKPHIVIEQSLRDRGFAINHISPTELIIIW